MNGGLLLTADFISEPTSIFEGVDDHFIFTGTDDDPPMTYIWDFGDNKTSTEKNPKNEYTYAVHTQ
ncbi:MAG: PKD domain-containing protein [Candidatus Thorarchaeota archaeon]